MFVACTDLHWVEASSTIKIQRKRITICSHQWGIKSYWRPRKTAKSGRNIHRTSCSMVGHPSVPPPKLDNYFNVLRRMIWRKIASSRSNHSQVHSRSGSRSSCHPMWEWVETTWSERRKSMAAHVPSHTRRPTVEVVQTGRSKRRNARLERHTTKFYQWF